MTSCSGGNPRLEEVPPYPFKELPGQSKIPLFFTGDIYQLKGNLLNIPGSKKKLNKCLILTINIIKLKIIVCDIKKLKRITTNY